ncbi:unnamed protein product [Dimorphilus gyrociliatus]|uniref:Uncharacterized protein n=1 Tax=Dimorphilus gyrociliatus TaxID=2664684 RepID=A0A7I8VG82_9ANNE|nr:unnamed protein product [Dimorphilus gyrociliatus]
MTSTTSTIYSITNTGFKMLITTGAGSSEGMPALNRSFNPVPEELCPICGDKTSGYHYGLQTCESCKGFFKRTVQNKKVYSCVDNQNCPIDKTQRKRCPYCRFQKCLNVGMKLEAVRADRMRGGRNKFGPMYKRDRALKQQALRQRQQLMYVQHSTPMDQASTPDIKPDVSRLYPPVPTNMASGPTSASFYESSANFSPTGYQPPDITDLRMPSPNVPEIVRTLTQACSTCDGEELKIRLANTIEQEMMKWVSSSSYPPFVNEQNDLSCEILHLLCRLADLSLFHLVEWARQAIFFRDLQIDDQMKLLQTAWSQLLVLHFLYRQIQADKQDELILVHGHSISFDFIRRVGLTDWIAILTNTTKKLRALNIDEQDLACIRYLVLLEPDVAVTDEAKIKIENWQDQVSRGLQEYTISCYFHAHDKYQKLILMLPELKQLAVRCENYLYKRHLDGDVKEHNLLMEMLHSQRN